MVQVNLIPKVKQDLLKAQKIRNWVIFFSIVAGGAAIAIVVMMTIAFGAQSLIVGSNEDNIKKKFDQLSKKDGINEAIVLQNQLNQIDNIRKNAPNVSRLLGQIIPTIQTTGANEVRFASVSYDSATRVVSIDGKSKGYNAYNGFVNALKGTQILYHSSDKAKNTTCTVEEAQSNQNDCKIEYLVDQSSEIQGVQSYGDSQEGGKELSFNIKFTLNPAAMQFTAKDFAVKSPARKDVTDSKMAIPDNLFTVKDKKEEK